MSAGRSPITRLMLSTESGIVPEMPECSGCFDRDRLSSTNLGRVATRSAGGRVAGGGFRPNRGRLPGVDDVFWVRLLLFTALPVALGVVVGGLDATARSRTRRIEALFIPLFVVGVCGSRYLAWIHRVVTGLDGSRPPEVPPELG